MISLFLCFFRYFQTRNTLSMQPWHGICYNRAKKMAACTMLGLHRSITQISFPANPRQTLVSFLSSGFWLSSSVWSFGERGVFSLPREPKISSILSSASEMHVSADMHTLSQLQMKTIPRWSLGGPGYPFIWHACFSFWIIVLRFLLATMWSSTKLARYSQYPSLSMRMHRSGSNGEGQYLRLCRVFKNSSCHTLANVARP